MYKREHIVPTINQDFLVIAAYNLNILLLFSSTVFHVPVSLQRSCIFLNSYFYNVLFSLSYLFIINQLPLPQKGTTFI